MTALRPIELKDVDFLLSEYDNPESTGEFGWFGFRDITALRADYESGKVTEGDRGRLTVAAEDGSPVGLLSWRMSMNGPPPGGACWNLGIWIAAEHRGKGHGAAAQSLGAAYLFANTTFERVEASTEVDNIGEQKALEKAGFTREGVLRRGSFRDGAYRDMVMYSKLRGE
jgi:RimJ/RimL family protein N-acetyltransferase